MTRGRTPAPSGIKDARTAETRRRAVEMYADYEKREAEVNAAIEAEGIVLVDLKGKHYRNPLCVERDMIQSKKLALLRSGIFDAGEVASGSDPMAKILEE